MVIFAPYLFKWSYLPLTHVNGDLCPYLFKWSYLPLTHVNGNLCPLPV